MHSVTKEMDVNGARKPLRYDYDKLFNIVCQARFKHLVTRLYFTFSISETIIISVLSHKLYTFSEILVLFPIKCSFIFMSSVIFAITRNYFLHVEYTNHSNTVSMVFSRLFNIKTVIYFVIFFICSNSLLFAFNDFVGVTYLYSRYSINRRLYTWIAIPGIYTVQHVLFDLDRLNFRIDKLTNSPQSYITERLKKAFTKGFILAAFLQAVSPILFKSLTGSMMIAPIPQIQLLILSFVIFLQLDLVSIAFNSHMSVGCLHKSKPISTLVNHSEDVLISGLFSNNLFARTSAFQELAFWATFIDPILRKKFYSRRTGQSKTWELVLKACLSVINEDNSSVAQYLNKKQNYILGGSQLRIIDKSDCSEIFGSQATILRNDSIFDTNYSQPRYLNHESFNQFNHQRRAEESFFPPVEAVSNKYGYNKSVISLIFLAICECISNLLTRLFFAKSVTSNNNETQNIISNFGLVSKKNVAENLVPLPVCHAYAVLSLMGFFSSAPDEDPDGNVMSTVGEALTTLERSVSIFGQYSDWNELRPGDMEQIRDDRYSDSISMLYDVSIKAFLEIVIKYKYIINNLDLDANVVKLCQWVLEICS